MAWRFSAVAPPTAGSGAANHIPVFDPGTNARLPPSEHPPPLTGLQPPLVSRGESLLREYCRPLD